MRICLDLDGVICQLKGAGENYADLKPVEGAAEALRKLKEQGHYIIIHTARHMKSCHGNVGQVVARQGAVTLDWLARHDIPYDEIFFGKPWAELYIDDNGLRFEKWDQLDLESLPIHREAALKTKGAV